MSKTRKAPKDRTSLRCYKKSLSNKLICFDIFLINVCMFCCSNMRNSLLRNGTPSFWEVQNTSTRKAQMQTLSLSLSKNKYLHI